MAKKIVLFNNKGGVGKTTFLYHLGYALEKEGKRILFVDLDPQCNLTSNMLKDQEIQKIWDEKKSIFKSVEPTIKGTGDIATANPVKMKDRNIYLIPGDILLSEFEESLATAWVETLAGNEVGFRKTSAIHRIIDAVVTALKVNYVLIDVGPNLGSLNRSILLSCDYFFVPLVPDLYSLRGLENIGKTFKKWIEDWDDAKNRFLKNNEGIVLDLQNGKPVFAGWINQQFNIYHQKPTKAYATWTALIPKYIQKHVIDILKSVDENMVKDLNGGTHKLGDFKSYHSLAPLSQELKKPIFELKSNEAQGTHWGYVTKCRDDFKELACKIIKHL